MSEKAILFDSSRCTACRGCQVACKCWNDLPSTLEKNGNPSTGSYQSPMDLNGTTRILISFNEEAGGDKGVKWAFGRRSCQHCTDAPCATICPGGALKKDEATGFVSVDESKCIGCQFCVMACPYGVRSWNKEQKVVEKCTLCEQRISQGELPQCVAQCGSRARFFGDLEQGIDTFEAPAVGYDVDRSYDNLYTGNRVTLGELAVEYGDADVHHLPDVGNGPHFAYILRDREWKGGE